MTEIPDIDIKSLVYSQYKIPDELFNRARKAGFYKKQTYFNEKAIELFQGTAFDLKYKHWVPVSRINDTLLFINILIHNCKYSQAKRLAVISLLLSEICIESLPGMVIKESTHVILKTK